MRPRIPVTAELKDWARQATHAALRRGILDRTPCEVCGDSDVQAHHPDYHSPLKVTWLCVKHHADYHGQRGHGVAHDYKPNANASAPVASLAERRCASGLKQSDVERAGKFPAGTISHWETGRREPKVSEIQRWEAVLNELEARP